LLAHVAGQADFAVISPQNGQVQWVEANLPAEARGLFPSGDRERPFLAALREADASRLWRAGEIVDVATREKLFWFTVDGAFAGIPEGRHSRHSALAHLRTDFMGTVQLDPDFSRTDEAYWADATLLERIRARVATYDTDVPQCWEPCFTHRWFTGQVRKWAEQVDRETELPRYVLLDRDNRTGMYGEFGQTDAFTSGSYAPGLAAVEAMYTYPQRAFLRELVAKFRANPEHFVAVEPNHEMEINPDSQDTHGDYNPEMIRNFYSYLATLYGGLEGINEAFGTPFTPEWFDAPRDLSRGPWDAYSVDNPYYMVWMRFMNMVIYRVVAGTYREALLAGFPPEAIKCHQIPDHYAIASLTAFSRPAQRVTPIDWNLTAGVGFGFTRYGVWYGEEHNAVQGPHSSGFDHMVVGEYQSLHPDAQVAYEQLAYMRDHGVSFVHNMNWPEGHDRGYNAALRAALERIVAEDRPRAGVTGGTGQVRAARVGGKPVDIVSLGTTTEQPGLLKSIRPDGSWEGSVYVQPFHAHVDVTELRRAAELRLAAEPLAFGPFAGIDAGNAIEVSFLARSAGPRDGTVALRVLHAGHELNGCTLRAAVDSRWRAIRFIVRVQLDCESLSVELASADGSRPIAVRDLLATRQRERTLRLKKGEFEGQRHQGGVTFDVLR